MHAFSKDNLKAMCWALCIVFFGALLSTAWNRFAATSYASCAAVASPSAMSMAAFLISSALPGGLETV